jgi:hypothetical protein
MDHAWFQARLMTTFFSSGKEEKIRTTRLLGRDFVKNVRR